jgi:phage terminase large subunit GpA-like protein
MVRVLTPEQLAETARIIANDGFCASIAEIARDNLYHLRPPEKISTTEWAEKNRLVRNADGDGKRLWSADLTPYNIEPQDVLDEEGVNEVIMVKPGRSGGTVCGENYLCKMIDIGPMGDALWYLSSDDEVKAYVERTVKPIFEDHPRIAEKVGKGRSDNNDTSKRISGRLVEWLPAKDGKMRNRQARLIVMDEVDSWHPRMRASALTQARTRGRVLGSRRKVFAASHPDAGWASGIASAWEFSSRGIWVMPCAECAHWASPHPTKFWPDVPAFKLHYDQRDGATPDERIEMAERSAAMACPHCGALLDDDQRKAMIDLGEWMHRGQTLDPVEGIAGEIEHNPSRGYWVHGLMLKVSTMPELAKELEAALIKFQQTRKSDQLRETLAKVFGEVFEGGGARSGFSAQSLRQARDKGFSIGQCPADVKFIVAAVDPGGGKFDVSFRGFDLEARSWWIDRHTIRQRMWDDSIMRDIRPRERIEDWDVLVDQVIERRFPILGRDGEAMPVACVVCDVGDGNVVWMGREFARRMIRRGKFWGNARQPWARFRLIQGMSSPKAPELPVVPRKVSKDENNKPVTPIIDEWNLGVYKLKELAVERLAVDDGGPGQCYFASGIQNSYFDEYFNERLIDGKWERTGDNESLDLFAYEEAARLMLKPDRREIDWNSGKLPPWARPVPLVEEGGDPADEARPNRLKAEPVNLLSRFQSLGSENERES